MSIGQIRRRIYALRRKYALPLALMRLRGIVEEFCEEWTIAAANRELLPPVSVADISSLAPDGDLQYDQSRGTPLMQRIVAGRINFIHHFNNLVRYSQPCRDQTKSPSSKKSRTTSSPGSPTPNTAT